MKHRYLSVLFFFIVLISRPLFAQEVFTVEQVVALALEKNYDVLLSRNASATAATSDKYSWGVYLPTLNATGSTVWNTSRQTNEFADATKNTKGNAKANNIQGSVQLAWTLFDGTKMFATRERLELFAEQGELLVKDQMTNTVAAVVTGYYDLVRQKQQLRAIRELMAVNEERVKLAERKLEVGTGGKPELLQAKVDYNAQRTLALQQEALIQQQKAQLNALIGSQLPPEYDVADTIMISLDIREEDVLGNAENRNFALQAQRKNIMMSSLSVRERRGELLPRLTFNANYSYSRVDNQVLLNPYGQVFSTSNGYNYGFTINIPILNYFNTRSQVELARVTYNRQELLYNQLKLTVDVGLKNAFVAYDNARKVLQVEEENILVAKENVSIALITFKRGATTFVELRTAQQSLADAYTRLIQARYLAKAAETELLRLNGGLLK
jgi:outer membrane protein TolC